MREDGREDEVFTLIGPKRLDVPWKVLERSGWIAAAVCREIRVTLPRREAGLRPRRPRTHYRLAVENPAKIDVVRRLVRQHAGQPTLVIGQYLDQLDLVAERTGAPIITGKTPVKERSGSSTAFRTGEIRRLIVSKVGNFAIDLPDASVIQVSGTFGSRQEEAQRLGRLLRPKSDGRRAHFYTVVSDETVEQDFGQNRQRFLTEQGYAYRIIDADDLTETPG